MDTDTSTTTSGGSVRSAPKMVSTDRGMMPAPSTSSDPAASAAGSSPARCAPNVVYVFPLDVWPYAKMVPL